MFYLKEREPYFPSEKRSGLKSAISLQKEQSSASTLPSVLSVDIAFDCRFVCRSNNQGAEPLFFVVVHVGLGMIKSRDFCSAQLRSSRH